MNESSSHSSRAIAVCSYASSLGDSGRDDSLRLRGSDGTSGTLVRCPLLLTALVRRETGAERAERDVERERNPEPCDDLRRGRGVLARISSMSGLLERRACVSDWDLERERDIG